jgi:hypothetical protein
MALRWQGLATGFLALTLLEVVVSSPTASSQAGGLFAGAGKVAQKLLSPLEPAFGATPSPASSAGPPPLAAPSLPGPVPTPVAPSLPGMGGGPHVTAS